MLIYNRFYYLLSDLPNSCMAGISISGKDVGVKYQTHSIELCRRHCSLEYGAESVTYERSTKDCYCKNSVYGGTSVSNRGIITCRGYDRKMAQEGGSLW